MISLSMAPSIFSLFQHTKLIQQQGQNKSCTVCVYRKQIWKQHAIVSPKKFGHLPLLPSFSCPGFKPFHWPPLSQSFDNLKPQPFKARGISGDGKKKSKAIQCLQLSISWTLDSLSRKAKLYIINI